MAPGARVMRKPWDSGGIRVLAWLKGFAVWTLYGFRLMLDPPLTATHERETLRVLYTLRVC